MSFSPYTGFGLNPAFSSFFAAPSSESEATTALGVTASTVDEPLVAVTLRYLPAASEGMERRASPASASGTNAPSALSATDQEIATSSVTSSP